MIFNILNIVETAEFAAVCRGLPPGTDETGKNKLNKLIYKIMETLNYSERFAIICKTDLYHASRHSGFDRHTGVRIEETGLTLREAHRLLLDKFCNLTETWYPNWGLAVARTGDRLDHANATDADGLRSFSYDVYNYSIVPMLELTEEEK